MTPVEIETLWVTILGISLLAGILSGLPVIFVIAGIPTLIGFIARHTGLAPIFLGLSLVMVVMFFLAPVARHADGVRRD